MKISETIVRNGSDRWREPGAALAFIAIGALAAALPIIGHVAAPALGPAMSLILAVFIVRCLPALAPPLLLFLFAFQNTFVALLSPLLDEPDTFDMVRGYNFLTTSAVWAVFAAFAWRWRAGDPAPVQRMLAITTLMLAAAGLYGFVGAVSAPRGAAVYLRNIALPIMLFQVALVAAVRLGARVDRLLPTLAVAVLAFGYAELLAYGQLARLINADGYMALRFRRMVESGFWLKELQMHGRVLRDHRDMLLVNFFNVPWFADLGLAFHRLNGPNFHPISFSYLLSILSLTLAASGRLLYLPAAVPLLVVAGSKGAVVFLILSLVGLVLLRVTPRFALAIFAALLLAYCSGAFVTGLAQRDFHVLGLVAGLNGFLANPVGHGLGSGGNLATEVTSLDWGRAQALGTAGQAVESALGVLLYQMGLAGVGMLAGFAAVGALAWRLQRATAGPILRVVGLAVPAMLANSAFQEEALFAPLAMGALMIVAGLAIGEALRRRATGDETERSKSPRPSAAVHA